MPNLSLHLTGRAERLWLSQPILHAQYADIFDCFQTALPASEFGVGTENRLHNFRAQGAAAHPAAVRRLRRIFIRKLPNL